MTDIPRRVEAAVEMIQHLDSQTPQVEIVAKLVDVDARFSRELGILWGVGGVHSGVGLAARRTWVPTASSAGPPTRGSGW